MAENGKNGKVRDKVAEKEWGCPHWDNLTQQHFTFHDGEKKDYSSQSSCIINKKCAPKGTLYLNRFILIKILY